MPARKMIGPAPNSSRRPRIAIVGGGPAGLMAAERLSGGASDVHLYDAMPSVGRKFLLAGRGGLNLTHVEPADRFVTRFAPQVQHVAPMLATFGQDDLARWVHGLGIETFVGSSGRVFPTCMKASPLLRAWIERLRTQGVQFHARHRWVGWPDEGQPTRIAFSASTGPVEDTFDAVLLALGGASWPRLGSDGRWVSLLERRGVSIKPLQSANCGFDVDWSPFFVNRFAGHALKTVALLLRSPDGGVAFERKGEFVATANGVEGSLVYTAAQVLRDRIVCDGVANVELDLLPDIDAATVRQAVQHPRGSRSLGSHLKSRLRLDGIKGALLVEVLGKTGVQDVNRLTSAIKALPLRLLRPRPIAEAISTAGGVDFNALDNNAMVCALAGVFCAGEMLDWEAPTGGYLLTASMASGVFAAAGIDRWIGSAAPR